MKTDDEYLKELTEIVSSTTYTGWARRIPARHPELQQWLISQTIKYNPINLMESIFIVFNKIIPPVCSEGNKCRFVTYTVGYQQTCNRKCKCFKDLSRKLTIDNQSKYSDEKWKEINDRVTATCIEKYGHPRASITKETIEKTKQTNLRKYGNISYTGSEEYKKKCFETYGVDHTFKCVLIQQKIKNTNLLKYGVETPFQSESIRQLCKKSNLEKYGYENPIHNKLLKQKAYNTQVNSGKYTHPSLKNDWEIYKGMSHFKGSIDNFIHTTEQWELFERYGLYSSKSDNKNLNGLVRDHKFSRRHGFDFKVFPEIIRHPINCILIPHRDNASKGYSSCISLDQLFDDIFCYKKMWYEQKICLELIDKYLKDEQWTRRSFKEE